MELYVYYKLHAGQTAAALAAFEAARGQAPVRLLQRQDSDPCLMTWMEVYGPGLDDPAGLERRIAAAMAGFVLGLRYREVFEPLTAPT